jgi:hypothetical protein
VPDLAEVAAQLRNVLAAIERGEVTASNGQVRRIEGAIAALEAVELSRDSANH